MATSINAKLKKSDRQTNIEKYKVAVQLYKVLQKVILGQNFYLLRHIKVGEEKKNKDKLIIIDALLIALNLNYLKLII